MLKAHSEKREYRHKKKRLKTHEKGMFSTQFWMTLLKTYFLNEMVMSFQSDGPARAKARSPQDL